jgi:hypothetical protein
VKSITQACRDGELTGAKRWQSIEEHSCGELVAYGVNLGARGGSGSGRYVRVYDKGLETGEAAVGEWERWEAELSDDCAETAADLICQSRDGAGDYIERIALGAVDFRVENGYAELARRPRCDWWMFFVEGLDLIRTMIARRRPALESAVRWLRGAVAPMLQTCADKAGVSVELIWRQLVGTVKGGSRSPVVAEYLSWRSAQLGEVACG